MFDGADIASMLPDGTRLAKVYSDADFPSEEKWIYFQDSTFGLLWKVEVTHSYSRWYMVIECVHNQRFILKCTFELY